MTDMFLLVRARWLLTSVSCVKRDLCLMCQKRPMPSCVRARWLLTSVFIIAITAAKKASRKKTIWVK